jgi:predicted RNA methylase
MASLDNDSTLLDFEEDSEEVSESPDKKVKLGNTRVTGKEQYYTPNDTAQEIFENLLEMVPDLSSRVFIEPAGGTGSFINAAIKVGIKDIISYDIEPHHPKVKAGDFLLQQIDAVNAITVTNPPFGRNNSLSIPFFNHSAKTSEYIVFVVPRSWRKWTVQNKLDRRFELLRDDDLTINYVDVNGEHGYKNNNLRTCIQYWKRSDTNLRPIYAVEDMGIITKCKFDEADVSLTIFGYGCGTVKTDFPRKPNTTQMFLKLNHPMALEALQSVDFSKFFNHTAYTEALSIVEINYLLNQYVFGDPKMKTEDTKNLFDQS